MQITVALLTAAASVALAVPHVGHQHQHLHHKRDAAVTTDIEIVPGPTIVAYVLDGEPISAADVEEGIKNGTLTWASGTLAKEPINPAAYTSPPETSSAAPTTSSTSSWTSTASPPPSSPTTSSQSSTESSAPAPPAYSGGGGSGWDDSSSGVNTPFPNNQISCNTFPSQYGAVAVDWIGLDGWIGVQSPGSDSGGYSDISTAVSGGCTEGAFCSYACPPGYQKSQWPSTQGSTGQSVGGLQCTNGKLQLTNPNLSNQLCIQGATEVTVQVKNELNAQVAVCRTDYPGTEAQTVPVDSQPGSTTPLTCPNSQTYYQWEGSHTSAQYYVNPMGVSVEDGCQWGSDANPWGNYAPLNLGVGYSNGAAWLSIFQNSPTTDAQLDFTVEIQGDGISGTCRYSNGQYCGGSNYNECSSTTGCTVSISSGTATFVFSS